MPTIEYTTYRPPEWREVDQPPDDAPDEQWLDWGSVAGVAAAIRGPEAAPAFIRVADAYLRKWAPTNQAREDGDAE